MKSTGASEYIELTELEGLLKHFISLRPDLRERVLNSQELTEYYSWMAHAYRRPVGLTNAALPAPHISPQMSGLVDRLLADPLDDQARGQLSSLYDNQLEESYIQAGHDIAIGRILRYMPAHWHSTAFFEIYYAFSGNCRVYFQDETVELKPGNVLITAPSAIHAGHSPSDDCVLIYYMIRSSTFDQVFWNQLPQDSLMATFFRQALSGDHPTSYLHFETHSDPEIRHLLQQIRREFSQTEAYQPQMLNALMSTFFILLLRRYEGTARLPRTGDFYWKHEFSAILSHIQTHYASVTLAELAAHFHYSERQISRIVKRCTGITYNQLILKLRMEKAALLLRQQSGSIETISAAVGYSTVSSFYRAFTGYFGQTPGEYA